MRAASRVLVAFFVAAIVITGVVVALPWSHDLDNQISIKPQEAPMDPPEFSVPVTGREFKRDIQIEAKYTNPVAGDTASENRGEHLFATFCTPCHGQKGEGMGKVVQKGFLPPPMLTSSHTRGLSDGWIYSYIRHGGVVMMPPYAFGVRAHDAWDLVNFVRKLQRENPTP